MNKLNRKALMVSALVLSIEAVAFIASANHSWGGYHWARATSTFTLKLGDNVSSTWDSYLNTTSADWSVSSVLDTTIVAGKSKGNCQPTRGMVEVCNKTYGNNGWLGIAQVWVSGDHITQATTKMNDTYFNTPSYNNPAWRQFVMCQEVGHTFGLDHQDENFSNLNIGTCMDYTNNPARNDGSGNNLHPNAHDYEELALIYSHLDGGTTIASSTSSSRNSDEVGSDSPSDWGKEIKKDLKKHSSTFEKELGQGKKVFTFVIWAD